MASAALELGLTVGTQERKRVLITVSDTPGPMQKQSCILESQTRWCAMSQVISPCMKKKPTETAI